MKGERRVKRKGERGGRRMEKGRGEKRYGRWERWELKEDKNSEVIGERRGKMSWRLENGE